MGVITSHASCLTFASGGRFNFCFVPKHLGNRAQAVEGLGGGLSFHKTVPQVWGNI